MTVEQVTKFLGGGTPPDGVKYPKPYMEYNGNLFRHYIRNYWYEVGTKFDDRGTKFVENLRNAIPK